MTTTCRRVLALVGLMVGFSSLAAMALPGLAGGPARGEEVVR